jgi:bacterioferritin-associated ferredoxin
MDPDAEVCLCFHVTRRKLENFARRRQPRVVSQLSECGGAGSGCGWCVPFLKQIFKHARDGAVMELEQITPQDYGSRRAKYVRAGGGTPPAGATPLPPES